MADETIVNGLAPEVDDQTVDDGVTKQDRVDLGNDTKVSELNRKIEALEQEKFQLVRENEESNKKVQDLAEAMERFKKEEAEMKERLDEKQREIDGSEEDKKALQAIAARAFDLETEVSRLQHDLISSMSENRELVVELRQLKGAYEEIKQSNHEKELKVEDLEKEKVSLLERSNREVEEIKKSKAGSDALIRNLEGKLAMEQRKTNRSSQNRKLEEELTVKLSEKESKIFKLHTDNEGLELMIAKTSLELQKLKREKEETEDVKSILEEALKKSTEKLKEMESVVNRLQNELRESEVVVRELKENNKETINGTATAKKSAGEDAEKGCKGLKMPWQTAVASTGTVAAAAAVLYFSCARRS